MGNPIFQNLKKFANRTSIKKYASHVYEFDKVLVIENKDEQWGGHE